MPNLHGESLSKFQNRNTERESIEKNESRNLRKLEYDTYITIYFKEDCTYQTGFAHGARAGVNFIRNTQNNENITIEGILTLNKNIAHEIHFNKKVINMNSFFSSSEDDNMINLKSIDFSNFDSTSVSYMYSSFWDAAL